jgi:hypothetical protein
MLEQCFDDMLVVTANMREDKVKAWLIGERCAYAAALPSLSNVDSAADSFLLHWQVDLSLRVHDLKKPGDRIDFLWLQIPRVLGQSRYHQLSSSLKGCRVDK